MNKDFALGICKKLDLIKASVYDLESKLSEDRVPECLDLYDAISGIQEQIIDELIVNDPAMVPAKGETEAEFWSTF